MRSCKRARGGIFTSKVFATLMAIVLCVGFIPYVPAVAYADTLVGGEPLFGAQAAGDTVNGGADITEDGTYYLADDATGAITIGENLKVTIVGKGAEKRFEGLNIKVGNGTTLTIQDLYANQGTGETAGSTVDFLGNGTLKVEGQNLIDNDGGLNAAVVHVGAGNEVHFAGTGTLYGYKSALCSYIGANVGEANGKIVFDGGYWFLKGTKTGAVIGGDSVTDKGGDIVINGGELYVKGIAKGALIGGSNQGKSGDVYINGGLVELFEDFSGPAIGAGNAVNAGSVTVTGGSLKTTLSSNSSNSYGAPADFNGLAYISWDAVKATNANDYALLAFDASAYISDLATDTVDVYVDGGQFYSGRAYTYVTNEVKNPSDITGTTTDNWLPNDASYKLGESDFAGAYPTKSGSSLAPEKSLYFALSKTDHVLKVNGDKYTATWDEAAGAFVVAAVPDPATTYDWDSTTWAGGLDFTWYDAENPQTEYHLTTPAQWEALAWMCSEDLAKLADYEANTNGNVTAIRGTVPAAQNTFEGVKFYLDNDIDMGGVYNAETDTWSGYNYYPIGSQAQNDLANGQFFGLFYGSFDGQGHYVNNIYCERGTDQSSQSVGLFGRVGAADGTPAPACDITIENVGVSGFIKSGRSVGGIVGKTLHVATDKHVYIKNCVNRATVRSTQKKGVGGIVGAFWNDPVMENCYSLGTAGGGTPLGSIVGGNEGTITNVYATQPVAVSGEKATSAASVNNAYQLEPGTGSQPGANKTEAEMKDKAFVLELNGEGSAFNVDTGNLNGGFPCLAWEGGTPYTAGDTQVIDNVVNVVAAIGGEVTVDSKDAIEAAKAAYGALTDDQKALLPAESRAAYDNALASYTGALVGAIPSDATSAAGIAAVEEALNAYNSLTAEQKALVPAASVATLVSAQQSASNAQIKSANEKASAADASASAAAADAAAQKARADTAEKGLAAKAAEVAAAQAKAVAAQAKAAALQKDVSAAKAAQKAAESKAAKASSGLKANTMTVKAKTIKSSTKKNKTFKKATAFTVKKAKGKVTFTKVSGNAKITVTKAGKVKVKKGLKKNKTYKVKVLVYAAGNKAYAPVMKTVTLKVKITK